MTIKLTAQQVSMRFKDRVLFHIPDLSIGPNDAIYLRGDNGVGKTTLLKILSGLLKPTTGRVNAPNDNIIQRLFPRSGRRDVVYLHQSPYLFDGTVYENVAYGIRFQKMSAQDKRAKVITALRRAASHHQTKLKYAHQPVFLNQRELVGSFWLVAKPAAWAAKIKALSNSIRSR